MSTKNIILSSSGLTNLVFNSHQEEEFELIFNENRIKMKTIFAEFISPKISKLHQLDPTLKSVCFTNQLCDVNFDKEVLSKLNLLSSGNMISITQSESYQLQLIALLLDNEELFSNINNIFPNDINENNIDKYLTNLTIMSKISSTIDHFDIQNIIDFISSHFYSIDQNKLIQIPKRILYSIISNEHLQIESEDSLFEFINKIFNDDNNDDTDLDIINFYEKLEFTQLSKEKFKEFISSFKPSEITNDLWIKICDCFYINNNEPSSSINEGRYIKKKNSSNSSKVFLYNENPFEGIIDHLTKESGGNVVLNGTVVVTSSSKSGFQERTNLFSIVDLHNKQNYFQTGGHDNSWIKLDFVDKKIHPTHYSLRNRNDYEGNHSLKNWVIEGTNINSDNDNDWKLLDSHQNDSYLNGANTCHTYQISQQNDEKEYYRYLRIRQTGQNSSGHNCITLSAIEFFGSLC